MEYRVGKNSITVIQWIKLEKFLIGKNILWFRILLPLVVVNGFLQMSSHSQTLWIMPRKCSSLDQKSCLFWDKKL